MPARDRAAAPVAPARWLLLAAFCLLVVMTQLLWLTFAPVTGRAARELGVSDGAIGDLAVVNPVVFVLLALPAGRLVDRRLPLALGLGAGATALGTLVRLVDPGSYAWVLAGQVVGSVGQPLVLSATTALAVAAFPREERPRAIAAGSAAQFVGVLLAAVGGAPVVEAVGLRGLLLVHAVVAVLAGLATVLALRLVPFAPAPGSPGPGGGWGPLLRDPLLVRLGVLLFVGVGVFNALATWLDPVMARLGSPGLGGPLVAVTTVAGIVGAAVLPGPAARLGRRREVLLLATVAVLVGSALLTVLHTAVPASVVLALTGFVLLAGLPVALEWSEVHVGAERAGRASAALLLAGNLGGVVLVLLVQPFVDRPVLALLVLAACALPGTVAVLGLPRGGGDAPAAVGAARPVRARRRP